MNILIYRHIKIILNKKYIKHYGRGGTVDTLVLEEVRSWGETSVHTINNKIIN